MAPKPPPPGPWPDIESIRALAAVLDEAGLTEIEIGEGGGRIRIARAPTPPPAAAPPTAWAPPPAAPEEGASPAPGADTGTDDAAHPGAVISPLVGVVYVSA